MTSDSGQVSPSDKHLSDPMLEMFVNLSNKAGLSVPLVLYIHGLVISGNLVGYKEYLRGMASAVSRSPGNFAEHLSSAFQGALDKIEAEQGKLSQEAADTLETSENQSMIDINDEVYFFHLSDVKIMHNSQAVSVGQYFWYRGRLDAVDGWHLGLLS